MSRSHVFVIVSLLAGGAIVTSSLSAQTKFLRPSRGVDIRNYTTLEECAALVNRIRDSVQIHSPLSTDIDTFPLSVANLERQKPFPAVLVDAAKTCTAQISPDAATPEEAGMLVPLLLRANRDAEAERFVDRLIAKTEPFNATETDVNRTAAIQNALRWYADARPVRYEIALRLVMREADATKVAYRRIGLLAEAADISGKMNDSARAKELTALVMGEYRKMTPQQISQLSSSQQNFMHDALGRLTRQELIDSLRSSVSAYIALRKTEKRFMEFIDPNMPSTWGRIGDRATPLQGEYWFTPGDPNATKNLVRPTPGKTSLIVFLSTACRRREEERMPLRQRGPSMFHGCFGTYAMLKRIMQQFPNAELTIATQTYGYFWPSGPLEPEAEANFVRQWLLDAQQLPGALVVAKTPFWHLDPPDGRRINDNVANQTAYNTTPLSAVLVDRSGTIIERFNLFSRDEESWVTQLLTVLEGRK